MPRRRVIGQRKDLPDQSSNLNCWQNSLTSLMVDGKNPYCRRKSFTLH